jgi:hypothetical protein
MAADDPAHLAVAYIGGAGQRADGSRPSAYIPTQFAHASILAYQTTALSSVICLVDAGRRFASGVNSPHA